MLQVKDIMNTDVKTITPDSTVQKAAKKMDEFGIGSLIVVKDGKLTGIVTERDILEKVVAKAKLSSQVMVKDIMTKEVIMVRPDMEVEDASEIMMEKRIKKLPVIKDDSLIGIITATDIVTAQPMLMQQLSELMMVPGKRKIVAG